MTYEPNLPPDPAIRAAWQDYADAVAIQRDQYNATIQRAYADFDAAKADADQRHAATMTAARELLESTLTAAWREWWAKTEGARDRRTRATDEIVHGGLGRAQLAMPAPVDLPPIPPELSSAARVPPFGPSGALTPAASATPGPWAPRLSGGADGHA